MYGGDLLTPTSLRLSTLSMASHKEGEENTFVFTLFFARKREGGRAKQRPGEYWPSELTPMYCGNAQLQFA
jgi:hypothetical protein